MEPIIKQNIIDGPGYGKGFHDLSDVISRILKHRHSSWGERSSTIEDIPTASTRNTTGLINAHVVSRVQISPNGKIGPGRQLSESPAIFPDFEGNDTFLRRNDPLRNHRIQINHDLRKATQWRTSRTKFRNSFGSSGIGETTHFEKSPKLANRLRANNGSRRKVNRHSRTRKDKSRSLSSFKDKKRKIPKLGFEATSKGSGLQTGARRKFRSKGAQQPSPPISRMLLRTHEHNPIVTKMNPTTKIRNLRKQLARLRAKLDRYIHLAHHRIRKKAKLTKSLPTPNVSP